MNIHAADDLHRVCSRQFRSLFWIETVMEAAVSVCADNHLHVPMHINVVTSTVSNRGFPAGSENL